MALAQIYTAVAGHVITAARWNNEFGNIYTNGTDVGFPVTKAVSFAGWTVTFDAAGVSTITSPATTGFLFTTGVKSGAPGVNGGIATFTAGTYTDNDTAASGTVALWTGVSIRASSLVATNLSVTTTKAASLYIENAPTASTNETITNPYALYVAAGKVQFDGALTVAGALTSEASDARTATVATPVVITDTTSGVPAAGIGTGILLKAESADESPSDVGQVEFAFSDVTAASEDSYFQILTRRAGAALAAAWRFVSTGTFKGIITHANTADRTYTFPDRSFSIGTQGAAIGPSDINASSSFTHEGTVTYSANQSLNGVHAYTSVTLDAAKTLTVDNAQYRLVLLAYDTITINGTINATGAGKSGGAGGGAGVAGSSAVNGSTQPGGGGGGSNTHAGGNGGDALHDGWILSAGGAGGSAAAAASAAGAALNANLTLTEPFNTWSGAPGGGGGGSTGGGSGGAGGRGGGSIVLVAPTVVLGAASVLKTSGEAGTNGNANSGGGGGGGGSGNILIICQSFTDNGCTYTTAGGAAGSGAAPAGNNGTAGRGGWLQILLYGG